MENKKRLIDANTVLKKMQNWNTKARLINCVEDAPTVDAVEVVHGRWVYEPVEFTYEKDIKCSICGCYAEHASNYCSHCGAKMDKEDNYANS